MESQLRREAKIIITHFCVLFSAPLVGEGESGSHNADLSLLTHRSNFQAVPLGGSRSGPNYKHCCFVYGQTHRNT